MQPQEVQQKARRNAGPFPYQAMFCVLVPAMVFAVFTLKTLSASVDAGRLMMPVAVSVEISFLVIAAAYGLGGTQGMLERRRAAGLPFYAALYLGVLSILLGAGWFLLLEKYFSFLWVYWIFAIPAYALQPLLTLLAIWLVFRLLHGREQPETGEVDLRRRAVLIFALFAWSWVTIALGMAVIYYALMIIAVFYKMNPTVIYLTYLLYVMTSIVFALPAFLGAVVGLPERMSAVRVGRLWLASLLAVLVCLAMAILLAVLYLRRDMSFGLFLLLSVIWLVLSALLCRQIPRVLMRTARPAPY
jgi:hypothetical protein